MLELIYIGLFDYLARRDMREASHLPDDTAVEAARRDLEEARLAHKKEPRTIFNLLAG
jgi:hypothetical protein